MEKMKQGIINFSDIQRAGYIPKRSDFLDGVEKLTIKKIIDNRESVVVMPCDVNDSFNIFNDGKLEYILVIYGSMTDGSKAQVIVTGIKPYIKIQITDCNDGVLMEKNIKRYIENIITDYKEFNKFFKTEIVYEKPVIGFIENTTPFIKVYFSNLTTRNTVTRKLKNIATLKVFEDDNKYYQKFIRENNISLNSWLNLSKYSYISSFNSTYKNVLSSGCQHVFVISCENISSVYPPWNDAPVTLSKWIDRTLIQTWDIETYSDSGDLPSGIRKDDNVFIIGCTFHWIGDTNVIQRICITSKKTDIIEDCLVIQCDNELEVIKSFSLITQSMYPDIITGFNDFEYDYRFILEKLSSRYPEIDRNKLFCDKIITYSNYTSPVTIIERKVKIPNVGDSIINLIKIIGIVPLDVRLIFRKIHNKLEETSLKFYLEEDKLPGKHEMPISELYRIYNSGKLDEVARACKYCVNDAESCQRLLISRNVIGEQREIGNLPFSSLLDTTQNADGGRVRSIIQRFCFKSGLVFPPAKKYSADENKERVKFPGAMVLPPIKGIENRRPVVGLDFQSLYPSIIMTYNLSPEKFISCDKIDEVSKEILKTNPAAEFHKTKVEMVDINYEGYFYRHGNKKENMGIYPTILQDLFNRRKEIKSRIGSTSGLEKNILDSKQKALKIFMNTFYGEAGNNISPLFLLELSGGVTEAGRNILSYAYKFVSDIGCEIKYGDTDSLYISCPESVFTEVDRQFINTEISKIEYWKKMVELTMEFTPKIIAQINEKMKEYSGSGFLKMAYEEVLFPVAFLGKKKYYGIPHKDKIKFDIDIKDMFIRGIDIVKRGISQFSKDIASEIMLKSMSENTEDDILTIIKNILEENSHKQHPLESFIKTASFRPNKKNIAVQNFVTYLINMHAKEMIQNDKLISSGKPANKILYTPPKPSDRFLYIIRSGSILDDKGNISKQAKGERMEYFETAKELNISPDLFYYFSSELVGICARFINYKFEEDDDQKEQDQAKKYLISYIKELFGRSPEDIKQIKKEFKRIPKIEVGLSYDKTILTQMVKKIGANKFITSLRTRGEIYHTIFLTLRRDYNILMGELKHEVKDETVQKIKNILRIILQLETMESCAIELIERAASKIKIKLKY